MNAPKGPAEVLRKSPERTRPCHATSPCLANTRHFLRLFSLFAATHIAAKVLHSSRSQSDRASPDSRNNRRASRYRPNSRHPCHYKQRSASCLTDLRPARRADARPASTGRDHLMIFATTPAPTVRPPSRIAKRRPSSIATGLIRLTTIFTLSPGITISTPSGSWQAPVMSVVRK